MLYNNLVGLAGNAVFFVVASCFYEDTTLARVMSDFSLLRDVLLIAFCGAVGQIFIFLTISLHDCYKLSIMTTSRKCLTVVISAFAFNHDFSQMQWFGATVVLLSTCAEVYLGNKRKRESQMKRHQELMFPAEKIIKQDWVSDKNNHTYIKKKNKNKKIQTNCKSILIEQDY